MDGKMPYVYVVLTQYLLLISLISTVHCAIQFQYDSEQCLGELVEYQCTVTGTGFLGLTWTISRDNGTQLGLPITYTSKNIEEDGTRGVFSVEQLSSSPSIVSNISFTVQSSINGYTIICEDQSFNNENVTIHITDPPPPLNSLSLMFSQNETMVAWSPPSYTSQCVSIASYTVNTTSTIISTTDTSVTIPLAGLLSGNYCVSVASVDTANRTGTYSEEECEQLSVPNAPTLSYESFNGTTRRLAEVIISWEFEEVLPPLINVNVSDNVTNTERAIPAADGESTFTIERDINYLFTVFGENIIIGNRSSNELLINVGIDEELPPPPTPETTDPTEDTRMNTNNTNTTRGSSKDDSGSLVIVIVSPIVVFVLLIVIVIVIIVVIVYLKKKSKSVNPDKNSGGIELKKTAQPIPASDEPSYYADLEIADTKKSQKKAAGGGRGGSSQPASATNYSAVKHEVVYTDVSHSVPAGKKPTPTPTVNYSAVTH